MKRSIFTKLFVGYVAVICLLSVLILFATFTSVKNNHISAKTADLRRVEAVLRPSIIPLVAQKRVQELDRLLKKTGTLVDMRLTVIDPGGTVLSDSELDPRTLENHRTRPEIMIALGGKEGSAIRYSASVHKEMLYVAVPVLQDGRLQAVLRASCYMENIQSLIHDVELQSAILSFIALCLALWFSLFLMRRFTRPLRELSRVTQTIATGDLNARVPLFEDEELRDLAFNFNNMADQVQKLFDEVSRQKKELQTIIASMQEAMVVITSDGRVLVSNASFRSMVQDQHPEQRYYWEFIRSDDFGVFVKQIQKGHSARGKELQIGTKLYMISGSILPERGDCVLMFWDITEAKNLERIKRDFVVNVSHELRTPLTAIKGFVETLQGEIPDGQRRYLDIIASHTERLISIVQDLLLLSEIQEKGFQLSLGKVDLPELLFKVKALFDQRLQEKGLQFHLDIPLFVPVIQADAFKLEQVFINLIDNAIKYSEKGEIRIALEVKGDMLQVTLSDTGLGIPAELLPRIFERFFVVDKSRSRRSGGTGLGLSIVKHIVLLHNGKIDVASELGVGTRVVMLLPIN